MSESQNVASLGGSFNKSELDGGLGGNAAALNARFLAFWAGVERTSYDVTHQKRFMETATRLECVQNKFGYGVELGGKSRIAEFLEGSFGAVIDLYQEDLRFALKIDANKYDFVLLLEVLEHINEPLTPNSSVTEVAGFYKTGARRLISEAIRILKPGGVLIMSTPNVTNADSIGKMLVGLHPFAYEPHVREYAPCDVRELFAGQNADEIHFSTFFAYNSLPQVNREKILDMIVSMGFDMGNRGDTMMFIHQKRE